MQEKLFHEEARKGEGKLISLCNRWYPGWAVPDPSLAGVVEFPLRTPVNVSSGLTAVAHEEPSSVRGRKTALLPWGILHSVRYGAGVGCRRKTCTSLPLVDRACPTN